MRAARTTCAWVMVGASVGAGEIRGCEHGVADEDYSATLLT